MNSQCHWLKHPLRVEIKTIEGRKPIRASKYKENCLLRGWLILSARAGDGKIPLTQRENNGVLNPHFPAAFEIFL
jgi:hypothetical protein